MLRDSLLLSIFNRITDPSLILSLNNGLVRIEALNDGYKLFMGNEIDVPLGSDFFSLIDSGLDAEDVSSKLHTSFSKVLSENLEDCFSLSSYPLLTLSGPQGIWEIQNIPLPASNNKISYILHTVKHISAVTEKMAAFNHHNSPVHQAADAQEVISTFEKYANEPFILLDRALIINFVSQSFRELYRYYFGKEIILGDYILNYAQPERCEMVKEIYEKVLSGNTEHSEIITSDLNGLQRKLSLTYKPIMKKEGVVSGIFVSGNDVTLQSVAEQKLIENERELELIYDNLKESVFVLSVEEEKKFKFNSINRSFLQTTALLEDSVIGAYIDQVIPVNHLAGALSHYNEAIEKKSSVTREEVLQYPSGERTVIITVTPVMDNGTCVKLIGSIHDISERKKAEKGNEIITKTLSKILDSSPDVICTLNEQGRFINVSAASNRMWGYSPYQLEGMFSGALLHKDDRKPTRNVLETIMNGREITNFENRLKRKDGSYISLVWSARWDSEERTIYCVAKDASEKKKIEEQVKASEQYFKALIQDGSDLIAILDPKGNYLYVSPTSLAVLGTAPEEYLGKNAFNLIHPDDRELTFKGFETLHKEHKVALNPFRFLHNDGSWRWVETIITNLLDDPAVRGIVANSRDITERINAQKAILVSNERYRLVSKATSDAIWDRDLETNTIYWGKGFQRLFHYRPDQLTSNFNLWEESVHPDDLRRVKKKLDNFLLTSKTQWRDEYRFARADGGYASVTDKGLVVRDIEGKAIRIVGAMQDVTKQKSEEHQLKLLESVVTSTNDLIMITEPEAIIGEGPKIIYVNPAFSRVTGYLPEEVIGKTPKILQGTKSDIKELDRLKQCINALGSCEISIINYKKNGDEFWNNFSISPVMNEKGKDTHWISVGRDVTDLRNKNVQEKLLFKINQLFNKTGGLGKIIGAALKLLTQSGKFCYAEIWLLDHDNKQLSLAGKYAADGRTKQF